MKSYERKILAFFAKDLQKRDNISLRQLTGKQLLAYISVALMKDLRKEAFEISCEIGRREYNKFLKRKDGEFDDVEFNNFCLNAWKAAEEHAESRLFEAVLNDLDVKIITK